MLPDLPSGDAALYYEIAFLVGRDVSARGGMLDAVFSRGSFGAMGSALHVAVAAAALLAVYAMVSFGRVGLDPRRILLCFLVGCMGYPIVDFLTHVDYARPLFSPLSGWEWSSLVSYCDPRYHGREFVAVEHGGCS